MISNQSILAHRNVSESSLYSCSLSLPLVELEAVRVRAIRLFPTKLFFSRPARCCCCWALLLPFASCRRERLRALSHQYRKCFGKQQCFSASNEPKTAEREIIDGWTTKSNGENETMQEKNTPQTHAVRRTRCEKKCANLSAKRGRNKQKLLLNEIIKRIKCEQMK